MVNSESIAPRPRRCAAAHPRSPPAGTLVAGAAAAERAAHVRVRERDEPRRVDDSPSRARRPPSTPRANSAAPPRAPAVPRARARRHALDVAAAGRDAAALPRAAAHRVREVRRRDEVPVLRRGAHVAQEEALPGRARRARSARRRTVPQRREVHRDACTRWCRASRDSNAPTVRADARVQPADPRTAPRRARARTAPRRSRPRRARAQYRIASDERSAPPHARRARACRSRIIPLPHPISSARRGAERADALDRLLDPLAHGRHLVHRAGRVGSRTPRS